MSSGAVEPGSTSIPKPAQQSIDDIKGEIQKAADARKAETWKNKSVFSKEYLVLEDGTRVKCRPLTKFEHFKALFGYGPKFADVMDQIIALHPQEMKPAAFDALASHYLAKKFEKLNDKLGNKDSAELSSSECISVARIVSRVATPLVQNDQNTVTKVKNRIKEMHANDLLDLVKTAVKEGRAAEAEWLLQAGGPNNKVDMDGTVLLFEIMKLALNKKMFGTAGLLYKNIILDHNASNVRLKNNKEREKILAGLSSLCNELSTEPNENLRFTRQRRIDNIFYLEQVTFSPQDFMKEKIREFRERI